jgi:hypothetical protein
MSNAGSGDNIANPLQDASRLATAGGSQLQSEQLNSMNHTTNNSSVDQKGQPTAQQLQDLAEALALIGDGNNNNQQQQRSRSGGKNEVEQEIEVALNSTGNNNKKKQQQQQQPQQGVSSLRNSYSELCKEEGCRPNSYLLQKLPVLPRVAQTIEALDMSHNYVGHSGFVAILRLLDLLPRIHSVYFNSMSLDNQDVISLCDTLAEHTTIHSVFLKNNPRITLPAAKSFFRLLKDNINIHTISLTGTGIGLALQQRIEKEATLNKEIQTQNEKMRKQQQQAAAAAGNQVNINNNINNQSEESSPMKMITLTVGAPNAGADDNDSGATPSVASGGTNQQNQQQQQQPTSSTQGSRSNEAGEQEI